MITRIMRITLINLNRRGAETQSRFAGKPIRGLIDLPAKIYK